MRTHLVRTSLAGLALLVGACGGSEQADTISVQPTSTTAPATTVGEAVEETTTTVAITPPTEVPAGVDDLERMSLKLADMPVGWSESIPDPNDGSDSAFCVEDGDPLIDTDLWPRVEKEFSAGAFGPFLSFSIIAAPDDGEAKEMVEQIADLAEQCPSWSDAEGNYTLSPVNYPSVGDDTFVIRLTAESDGFAGIADAIVIREGKILTLMVPLGVGSPVDAETVVGWMNLVDERD